MTTEEPAAGAADEATIDVGVLVSHTPAADTDALTALAQRVMAAAEAELRDATGAPWRFHLEDPHRLSDDRPQLAADFLDEASLRMVEGPYDVVFVLTDAPLVSRKRRVEPGLASPVARVAIVSTRKLRMTPCGQPIRTLDDPALAPNAATLLLRLMGHVLGLNHAPEGAMAPYRFDPDRREVIPFAHDARRRLRRRAPSIPEREHRSDSRLSTLLFYLASLLRHGDEVIRSLWRNRAPLLTLQLPALATAAVAPSFLLIFTAEIWDVGLHMTTAVNVVFATVSILGATIYMLNAQNLFFPHKEKRLLTEHLAVVNTTVLLSMLLGVIGLFVMLVVLMMAIEFWIFPPGLVSTWPTLEDPEVTWSDFVRLAAFISTIGVLTGALAGGLESRSVIRHLALFLDEP